MVQVSRRPLSKPLEAAMYTLFHRVLAELRSEREVADLIDDLLTPTEKIMLGKRLAIAFLLDKGYDQRTIHTMMSVSISTVNHVNFWLQNKGNGYRHVISMINQAEHWEEFWQTLDDRLRSTFSTRAMYQRVHSVPYSAPSKKSMFVK